MMMSGLGGVLMVFLCFVTMWNAFLAWFTLLLVSMVVCMTLFFGKAFWPLFIFFFLYVGGLSVLFMYFVSIQGKPLLSVLLLFGGVVVGCLTSALSLAPLSCYSCYLVKIKSVYYVGVSTFIVFALMLMKSLLSESSFAFRPTSF